MTGILCSLPIIGAPTAPAPVNPLAVSLNRTTVSGSSTASSITTNSVTATGSGGTSPYTYSWTRVSGNNAITASSANGRTTSFTRTGCVAGTAYSATWHCQVTDDDGTIVYSTNVSVTITCTASSGGGGTDGGTFVGIANDGASAIGVATSKTAAWSINSDGTYGSAGQNTWNSSASVGASYEVKATVTSGGLTTGPTGSWLSLSVNRSWTLTDPTQDSDGETCAFTLQIRQAGTTTVLDSATINLAANALSTA